LIYTCKGWDYACMVDTFREGIAICREKQQPVLFHIYDLTQPLGHSTSGSHERYKSAERLQWEQDHDAIKLFRAWIIQAGYADSRTLIRMEEEAVQEAREARDLAWSNFQAGFAEERGELRILWFSGAEQQEVGIE
ncbi:MAG: hypothetical protein LWW85_13440, partial [Marinilabiliales bacterium]|nr:hypothetical protein [Marinilabiliales bacterium]